MRIVIDNSGYGLTNLGDLAMLQVGVARLRELLPDATFDVITTAPERLAQFVPTARPLSTTGRELFWQDRNLFGGLHRLVPGRATTVLTGLERRVRRRWPRAAAAWAGRRYARRGVDVRPMGEYLAAVEGAAAVVATGGGFLTDVFGRHARNVLEQVGWAARAGKPTALFGQAIGPVTSSGLRRALREVLPRVDLIALREGRAGVPLLRSLGVDPGKVVVTGDDAIEPAYRLRPDRPGHDVGFNLRLASYSGVEDDDLAAVAAAVAEFARKHGARVRSLPVSVGGSDSDVAAMAGLTAADDPPPAVPEDLIRRAGACRAVVTGSYHAGVFALSQGVPVVGVAKSDYYRLKFLGLADQFGPGCELVDAEAGDLPGRVAAALGRAWDSADAAHGPLLRAAERQVAASQAAYERFAGLLGGQP